ncbi:hypothetical protein QVD17_30439 [Tagetes erecta]|uniref:Uncharacterized protein n=1 Tax=Tagetes erecta TaxID=13708 RepID=A0AAD8K2P4_TARER|nr:hypothetical protein QVD17_30439 [Tagetes erecta]
MFHLLDLNSPLSAGIIESSGAIVFHHPSESSIRGKKEDTAELTEKKIIMDERISGIHFNLFNELDVAREDYTLKVRIKRLLRQPMFCNPTETYSIEMILLDEEGKRIRASVLNKFFNRGNRVFVTLWDSYATEMSNYLEENPDQHHLVIILKFESYLESFRGESSSSSSGFPVDIGASMSDEFLINTQCSHCIDVNLDYDDTGVVLLTIFEREMKKLIGLIGEEMLNLYLKDGVDAPYPNELNAIVDKKYAFKVDVTQFNKDQKLMFFGVSSMTDDLNINELE